MSCLHFGGYTDEQLALAASQHLKFSSPKETPSKRRMVREMSESLDPKIRVAAAGSPYATHAVLLKLSTDQDTMVRSWVIRNYKTPRHILEDMSNNDPMPFLRTAARWRLSGV